MFRLICDAAGLCLAAFLLVLSVEGTAVGQPPASEVNSASPSVSSSTGSVSSATPTTSSQAVQSIFDEVVRDYSGAPPETQPSPSENIMTPGDTLNVTQSIGTLLISLAVVILIGLVMAWFFKRFVLKDRTLGGGKINLHASYALSAKSQVHLLQVGNRFYLVGEGNNSLSLISEIDTPDLFEEEDVPHMLPAAEPHGAEPVTQTFGEKLAQWQGALKSKDITNEVRTSLLLLGGLTQRLRKKRGGQHENS